jgi:hypothetical protein
MRRCAGASVRPAEKRLKKAGWAFKLGAEVMILLLRLLLLLLLLKYWRKYTQYNYGTYCRYVKC